MRKPRPPLLSDFKWVSAFTWPGLLLALIGLGGCLEAQPAPDLPVRGSRDFHIETITQALASPWALARLPGGDYLVTERSGKLWQVSESGQFEISGLPNDIYVAGQGGLFDVKLAPQFSDASFRSSSEIFLSYAYGTKAANGTAIFRAKLDGGRLIDGEVIYRSLPTKDTSAHFGGRMTFMPGPALLLSIGDGFTYREAAQKQGSALGKIIRIDTDGQPFASNPFIGRPGAAPEIYSLGHRNVQGLYFDAMTGLLWASEHGPRGGDEINLIQPGDNYGWPIATTGRDYNGARISPFERYDGMASPVHDWVPSIAPSNILIYHGDLFANWQGDMFVTALAGKSLRRLDFKDTEPGNEESLLSDMNLRFRDIAVDADGALLLLAEDENGGYLLRLRPASSRSRPQPQ